MVFDCYMIVGEVFKNVIQNGEVVGYQFGLRLPYFSSVPLSLVAPTELKLDGETVSEEAMTLTLRGQTYPKTSLCDDPVTRWEFGEIGILTVRRPGGLPPGQHTVDLRQGVKIYFHDGVLYGHDVKQLTLL